MPIVCYLIIIVLIICLTMFLMRKSLNCIMVWHWIGICMSVGSNLAKLKIKLYFGIFGFG